MPRTRFVLLSFAALLAIPPTTESLALDLSKTIRVPLAGAVKELAKKGRPTEVLEVIDLMQELGVSLGDARDLVKLANKELARAKKRSSKVPRAASLLRRAAEKLAEHALTIEDHGEQQRVAKIILRLDGGSEVAHELLGHRREGRAWAVPDEIARGERRAALSRAITQARHLELDIETGESDHPLLREILGRDGAVASWGRTRVHGSNPPEELKRILGEALRACAVTRFLAGDGLAVPSLLGSVWIIVDSEALYQRAVEEAVAAGGIRGARAENAHRLGGFFDQRGYAVLKQNLEAELTTTLFCYLAWSMKLSQLPVLPETQTCLSAALLNLVAMSYIGWPKPDFAAVMVVEHKEGGLLSGTSAEPLDETARIRREEIFRMAKAGLVGCRSFIAYLVEQGEDPPYRAAMVEDDIDLSGVELMKATLVAQFLAEEGELPQLLSATLPKRLADSGAGTVELFEEALGAQLSVIEQRFADWVVPPRAALADRVGAPPPTASLSRDERALLSALNDMRKAATGVSLDVVEVGFSRELSDGAARHARYLAKNPDQASAWPDAHEEYVDAAGFSPAGAWAGGHSVVAPGSRTMLTALESWSGTFYHRLPLLKTGLIRVGIALEEGCAVMDIGSLALPTDERSFLRWQRGSRPMNEWLILWPHEDMKEVPTRFEPELPNPVPGEDQTRFGYPVTLMLPYQFTDTTVSVDMTLREGSPDGKRIDCFFSTPKEPTNSELAPEMAWCLIPKQKLLPRTTYVVLAPTTFESDGKKETVLVSWRFHT